MWLLLTAAYGLVNAESKWQHLSDDQYLSIVSEHNLLLPQLFVMHLAMVR